MSKQEIALRKMIAEAVAQALATAQAQTAAPAPAKSNRKAKAESGVHASAGGFAFAWTHEKVKGSGAVQYRLVISRGKQVLTRGNGYPYAVREEESTLAQRVALAGVPKFALGLAKSLAKNVA